MKKKAKPDTLEQEIERSLRIARNTSIVAATVWVSFWVALLWFF